MGADAGQMGHSWVELNNQFTGSAGRWSQDSDCEQLYNWTKAQKHKFSGVSFNPTLEKQGLMSVQVND